jgi:flagellar motor switch protein FliN/FliY
MMNMNVANPSDALLEDLSEEMIIDQPGAELTDSRPRRRAATCRP